MPHNLKHKIVRRRTIIKGGGIRDDIIEIGHKGVRYLKHSAVNGVRRLVPIATNYAASYAHRGIEALGGLAANKANSLMHSMGDMLQDRIIAKTGGSVARPGRSLMLREINQALSRTSIR